MEINLNLNSASNGTYMYVKMINITINVPWYTRAGERRSQQTTAIKVFKNLLCESRPSTYAPSFHCRTIPRVIVLQHSEPLKLAVSSGESRLANGAEWIISPACRPAFSTSADINDDYVGNSRCVWAKEKEKKKNTCVFCCTAHAEWR